MLETSKHQISLNNLVSRSTWLTRSFVWVLDRFLGIRKMNKLYHLHEMEGLSKEDFADKLIDLLALNIKGLDELKARIPKTGPVVIASNHPFGGIEGVILASAIGEVRPDVKTLANKGLSIFKELRDYFIFTNPLSEKDPANGPSLRQCIKHVKSGNALLIFPAGRVSYYQAEKEAISEHTWNKIVGRLVSVDDCQFVPVFVNGNNSKWFYRLGRVYFRLRMLMLARELLNKTGAEITVNAGFPVKSRLIKADDYEQKAKLCRSLSYAQDARWRYNWPPDTTTEYKPLLTPVDETVLQSEISAIPDNQLLFTQGEFSVYFGYQSQFPNVVKEIARLRELVFRAYNEGSGEPLDTDHFDATYTHLFICKNNAKIMGAYRMGQTDKLLKESGLDGLYLHKMFKFSPEFVNQQMPCLELGRSFLVPEFQGSYQGLLLLWRGICRFAYKFPQYRVMYGTVSISKLYDPRSVKLIEEILIKPEHTEHVSPRQGFDFKNHSEIAALQHEQDLFDNVSGFLKTIEADGKDIPVLAKQYLKMGAKFHALGIDTSFNHTPGLLLSVHLPSSPAKQLKLYMGADYQHYIDFDDTQ